MKKTILYTNIVLAMLLLGLAINPTQMKIDSEMPHFPNAFEPNSAVIHDQFAIAGNSALDAFCAGNDTDGNSWETAHVIENLWISADFLGSGIELMNISKYLIIENCFITNAGAGPTIGGIYMLNCSNIEIRNCGINKNNYIGIMATDCSDIRLLNNEIINNFYHGIYFYNTSSCVVINNTFRENQGNGLYIELTENNVIQGNKVTKNFADGMELEEMNSSLIEKNIVFLNDGDGLDMWGGDSGNFNIINDNVFSNNTNQGISFDDSNHHNIIMNNEINYNGENGIYMIDDQYNNTISGNTIMGSYSNGISIPQQESSHNCTISGNFISKSDDDGISIEYNANMSIIDNLCTENNYGIFLDSVEGGIIRGNTVSYNNVYGIYLDWAENFSVTGNNASYNQIGIRISGPHENIIWLNYISNNSEYQGRDSVARIWDNGTVGNYWGDYLIHNPTATPVGNIWNQNYTINGTGQANDTHPLVNIDMGPIITPSPDLNYTVNGTGNLISWLVTDMYLLEPTYTITRDGEVIEEGNWLPDENITTDVDGLEVGTYTFKISFLDGTAWGKTEATIRVSVEEPSPVVEPEPEPEPDPEGGSNLPGMISLFYWIGIAAAVIIIVIITAKKR